MFISTLQAYFEGRKELFKGLAIKRIKAEKGEEWQSYPVLKLDLNDQKYLREEDLTTILNDHIRIWEENYNVKTGCSDVVSAFDYIIQSLYKNSIKK